MNILIAIEYDGTNYAGWQYQPNKRTIQGEIEKVLSQILQEKIKIIGAARTDAGVSAKSQIANFHLTELKTSLLVLQNSINALLPNDIYVHKTRFVPTNFNARFDSKSKVYQYKILLQRSPLKERFAWVLPYRLHLPTMRRVAKIFLKQKDYRAFCKIKNKNGVVKMKSLRIRKNNPEINITIEANRFLYKMVRRIVGALVEIGRGHRTEDDLKKALAGIKHRPLICAPAKGLLLLKVKY